MKLLVVASSTVLALGLVSSVAASPVAARQSVDPIHHRHTQGRHVGRPARAVADDAGLSTERLAGIAHLGTPVPRVIP